MFYPILYETPEAQGSESQGHEGSTSQAHACVLDTSGTLCMLLSLSMPVSGIRFEFSGITLRIHIHKKTEGQISALWDFRG